MVVVCYVMSVSVLYTWGGGGGWTESGEPWQKRGGSVQQAKKVNITLEIIFTGVDISKDATLVKDRWEAGGWEGGKGREGKGRGGGNTLILPLVLCCPERRVQSTPSPRLDQHA